MKKQLISKNILFFHEIFCESGLTPEEYINHITTNINKLVKEKLETLDYTPTKIISDYYTGLSESQISFQFFREETDEEYQDRIDEEQEIEQYKKLKAKYQHKV